MGKLAYYRLSYSFEGLSQKIEHIKLPLDRVVVLNLVNQVDIRGPGNQLY